MRAEELSQPIPSSTESKQVSMTLISLEVVGFWSGLQMLHHLFMKLESIVSPFIGKLHHLVFLERECCILSYDGIVFIDFGESLY